MSPKLARWLVSLSIAPIMTTSSVAQTTWYVDDDSCPSMGSGTLADPFCDLQDALAVAVDGDQIWVAEGTYRPAPPGGDRSSSFELLSSVALYGGFPSGFGDGTFAGRDPHLFVTVLSGDLNGDDQPGFVNYADNSHSVVTAPRIDIDFEIDGFTITAGSGGRFGGGAGIRSDAEGNLTIRNCAIKESTARFEGGGINVRWGQATIEKCTFAGNRVGGCDDVDCWGIGAGLSVRLNTTLVTECTFEDNSTWDSAYGWYVGGAISSQLSTLTVGRSTFVRNVAPNAASEGATYGTIYLCLSDASISDSVFVGNSDGAIDSESSLGLVSNCKFSGNFPSNDRNDAPVIWAWDSDLTLLNGTLSGNVIPSGAAVVRNEPDSTTTLVNCSSWGNSGPPLAGHIDGILVSYSNIEGGWPGEGNIHADPLFAREPDPGPDGQWGTLDDDYGDLHLLAGSPCIDAGDNFAVPPWLTTDIDGLPRYWDDPDTPDTGQSHGHQPVVDMGPYEFGSEGCPDDDGDGFVTICHVLPPGHSERARTITVSVQAAAAHLAHGDSCGPCRQQGEAGPLERASVAEPVIYQGAQCSLWH